MADDYSIYTGLRHSFTAVDYTWFGATLALSSSIGLYHAIRYRNKDTPTDFLMGGREMQPLPVALSLIVTFLSPITLLGVPGEVFTHDTMFWWLGVAILLAVGGATHIFHVFFYKMRITSVFEYLDKRYGRITRMFGSVTWFINAMMYQAFVLCGPAMAINAVTGLRLWISIVSVGLIVTFYTTMGGMKTVIWTDSLQAVIILVGLLSVLIKGSMVAGGLDVAWSIASNASRTTLNDFRVDPTVRHSFWSVFVGGGFYWFSAYSINQAEVQRALSCSNQAKARLAMWLTGIGMLFIITVCCLIGVVMFAFYSDCDPLKFNNLISNSDQLLPLYVMDILHGTYGVPGIVLSCICAGSLSTISSLLNGMSAVVLEDYVRPYWKFKLSNKKATFISKLTVVVCGLIAIGLAFITSKAGSQMQISYSICVLLNGPLFGAFLVGILVPRVKQIDMIFSYLATFGLMLWLKITAFQYGTKTPNKQTSVSACNWNVTTSNSTMWVEFNTTDVSTYNDIHSESSSWSIYNLSYLYYSLVGTLLTVLIAVLTSFITGIWFSSNVSPHLIHPLVHKITGCCCPTDNYILTSPDEETEQSTDEKKLNEVQLLTVNQ